MAEYIADFAPDNLPDIAYSGVNAEQLAHMQTAMELPENQANFELSLLPIDTPEQRQAVADEWAGYEQAKGAVVARQRGAFAVIDGKDRSPQHFLERIEGRHDWVRIPFALFVRVAVAKVIKLNSGANEYDLLRTYYERDEK